MPTATAMIPKSVVKRQDSNRLGNSNFSSSLDVHDATE